MPPAPAERRRHARNRWRAFFALRMVTLVALLVLVFVVHASGRTLIVLHVVRVALIGVFLLSAGWARRRRWG